MMQTQCICVIMTILDSSSLMFTTSIQVYNTMSFVLVHRSRWHTLCFQVHWSSRVAGPAKRPGIHKVHGAPVPSSGTRVSPGEVVVLPMGGIGRSCCTRPDSWTEWSQYLQPEPQAAVPGLRWWANRWRPLFQAGFHISAWSSTWWSTTLPRQNRLSTTWIHYIVLLRVVVYYFVPKGSSLIS